MGLTKYSNGMWRGWVYRSYMTPTIRNKDAVGKKIRGEKID